MFILHRMATASLRFSNPNLLFHAPIKHFVSVPTPARTRRGGDAAAAARCGVLGIYRKRNGLSTSSAVAVDSSETAAPAVTEDKTSEMGLEEVKEEKKVVLPTNESSETLLRIRHSVTFNF